jgi:hypothetical protein
MENAVVLTGDLIGSTRVAPEAVDAAMAALSGAAQTIADWAGADTRFTRFRGDGWQIYLAKPALTLRATLVVLASLKAGGSGLQTRLSIAAGPVERLGDAGLSGAAGAAFTLSGRNLDRMPPTSVFIYADTAADDRWKAATLDLAHWMARNWTREQAEAVILALDRPRPTDEVLARRLNISRQAFQSRLKGSGLAAATSALNTFENDGD